MTPNEDDQTGTVAPGRRISFKTAALGLLLIVLTFAAAGLYIAAEVRLQKVEARAAAAVAAVEQRAAADREKLQAHAKSAAVAQAAELLKLSALPLSWAVRHELQEKNYREIGIYFQQLVGLSGVRRIVLLSRDGEIKVATDKKLEGRPASDAFSGATLEADSPAVQPLGTNGLEAIVPIMGLNARLGTLVIDYEPTPADQRPMR
jgi:hypothetical protein